MLNVKEWEQVTFLTKAVYCNLPIPSQFKYSKIDTSCGLTGVFVELEDYDLLLFRGTNSFVDWITNFKMIFFVPRQLKDALAFAKENIRPNRKTIIAGHSLGGAIVQYVCNEIELTNFVGVAYNPAGVMHLVKPKFDFYLYNFITDRDLLNCITRKLPWNFFTNIGQEIIIEDKISKNKIESHSNFQVFMDYRNE